MKFKLTLTLLLTSCLSHSAMLNNNGTGEFHIIPLYSTSNNLYSTVTISQIPVDGWRGTAVKIHVKPSLNSEPILSYNVYLTPNDKWSFAVGSQTVGGVRKLIHSSFDNSCTPEFEAVAWENGETDRDISDLTFGYIEVIEMGQFEFNESNPDGVFPIVDYLGNFDCQDIDNAFQTDGVFDSDSTYTNHGLLPANNSLSVESSLINVPEGVQYTVPVTTFSNFFPDDEAFHTRPNSNLPTLNEAKPESLIWLDGMATNLTFENGIDAINALLLKSSLKTPFITFDGIAAATGISLTMPTWAFNENSSQGPSCDAQHTYTFKTRTIDREGKSNPDNSSTHALCGNTTLINLKTERSLFGEVNEQDISPSNNHEGIFAIEFTDVMTITGTDEATDKQYALSGLPVIGVTFNKATNANAAPGLLAQYGVSQAINGRMNISVIDTDKE
ncbi:hypothetical protein [Marinicella rhabdoformis]|uniref:hypothetical protein n=1 Tax=Marinicella rhabdoformis TaxID=2580566 RepID=UPI0012AEC950|nr:hypothetical protein [Marinicella rhabdoformis]